METESINRKVPTSQESRPPWNSPWWSICVETWRGITVRIASRPKETLAIIKMPGRGLQLVDVPKAAYWDEAILATALESLAVESHWATAIGGAA